MFRAFGLFNMKVFSAIVSCLSGDSVPCVSHSRSLVRSSASWIWMLLHGSDLLLILKLNYVQGFILFQPPKIFQIGPKNVLSGKPGMLRVFDVFRNISLNLMKAGGDQESRVLSLSGYSEVTEGVVNFFYL